MASYLLHGKYVLQYTDQKNNCAFANHGLCLKCILMICFKERYFI